MAEGVAHPKPRRLPPLPLPPPQRLTASPPHSCRCSALLPLFALQHPYCQACGGDFSELAAGFRCSTCPEQYHAPCLADEQRRRRPAGRWVCPSCTRRSQLGREIDQVLAARGGGVGKEYRLKWRHRSHLHAEWVRLSELEAAAGVYPGLRRRLKVFEEKRAKTLGQQVGPAVAVSIHMQFGCVKKSSLLVPRAAAVACAAACDVCTDLFARLFTQLCFSAPQGDDEMAEGIRPAWLEVERVIAERQAGTGGSGDGARMQYLCKWRDLPYSNCTWEEEADIADYALLVQQFRCRLHDCWWLAANRNCVPAFCCSCCFHAKPSGQPSLSCVHVSAVQAASADS